MLDFAAIDGVIFDMDGVVWRGDIPLPGTPEIFNLLNQYTIPYVFATNNSSRTPQMYMQKFGRFGVSPTPSQIITSAIATAQYLRMTWPDTSKAYVIGLEGIVKALEEADYTVTSEQADFVVVGFAPNMTYADLYAGCYQIQGGARFIGTNPDKNIPEPHGFAPGAGSVIAALEAATGVAPLIIGKPNPPVFQMAVRALGISPQRTLMVGDRVETDIVGAKNLGLKTALVLSGISTRDSCAEYNIEPDGIFDDLAALGVAWQAYLVSR